MHVDPESPHYIGFREFQKEIQVRLRELRADRGLTQLDLADCGISPRHYTRLEQDPKTIISIWQLYRIAAYYGLSVSDIVDVEST